MDCVAPMQMEEQKMSWKAPKIAEIALGAEINAYACAETRK
jgi:coenzyme PQQ precursor peptide PqqA